jgi:hypothetical protein
MEQELLLTIGNFFHSRLFITNMNFWYNKYTLRNECVIQYPSQSSMYMIGIEDISKSKASIVIAYSASGSGLANKQYLVGVNLKDEDWLFKLYKKFDKFQEECCLGG